MEESCIERQEEELQALHAIFMDNFQDLREEPDEPPKVCLKLTPLQSVVAKEVYARVDLIIQYTADYPNQSPKLSMCNAEGISEEDVNKLQTELCKMAADLVGEVMVLQLAHHVQTCLHQHNKPQLSLYDEMMANQLKEEERLQAAERQRLQMEIEANKEWEENEKRKIEEELRRRDEAMKENKRPRTVVIQERKTKTDPATQSAKTKDPDTSPIKEVPLQIKQSGSSTALTQAFPSPKKTEGMPSGNNVMRRRRSSESVDDESGTRVIHFTSRGGHIVYCGKYLGKKYLTE